MAKLPGSVLARLDEEKLLRIRAGKGHRFLGIWVVVNAGRAFVRPWNDKKTGWRQSFRADPRGAIRIGDSKRAIRVRVRSVRGERLFDAIDAAYAAKYSSPANRKWVRGLQTQRRRKTTMELLPG
jgi:hypothetical protein